MKKQLLLLLLMFICCSAAQSQNSSAVESVVGAEKAFARTAEEKGTKAAFLQFAADNGLVFNPIPLNAREAWSKRSDNSPLLVWQPAWADASASGDFGYTTGPWSMHPKSKADTATSFGEYVTIWKKQPGGDWKFVLEIGIQHAKPEGDGTVALQTAPANKYKNSKSEDANVWRELENEFSTSILKNGLTKTYEKHGSEQIRLLRQNYFPFVGKKNALKFFQIERMNLKTNILAGEAASDLAYAYGEYDLIEQNGKINEGYYLRIWKREPKGWRIALDIQHPFPPGSK
ncbi:MAG TPA: hypothetical protein VEX64_02025 [Pyrinomonadaceae bacterium]|nr:hypothetical protein [Pyrinomonadaceae bacterium]